MLDPSATDARAARVYAACQSFFAGLATSGAGNVVVSPGSRSTPLAVSASRDQRLRTWVVIDERSAAFFALGLSRQTRAPVVLVCTSGTAGANYLPAVIEAHHSGVPLVVCTADRPPELRSFGAGQTIDQLRLFGVAVRWFHELPVGEDLTPAHAALVAVRAVASATDDPAGPVHLNWPLREPLEPPSEAVEPATLPAVPRRAIARASIRGEAVEEVQGLVRRYERGLVVVGPADLADPVRDNVSAFAAAAGWPVVADPASGLRRGRAVGGATIVGTGDLLLGTASFAARMRADVVIRVGPSPTSKPYRQWVGEQAPREQVLITAALAADWGDPTDATTTVLTVDPGGLLGAATVEPDRAGGSGWLDAWQAAEASARRCLDDHVAAGSADEIAIAAVLGDVLPAGTTLVASSSMPIRDLDVGLAYAERPMRVIANRGANGIDGVTSTAVGVAAGADGPVVLFTGDLALIHDLGGLVTLRRSGRRLVLVVVDNDGGGIFSFLPIAQRGADVAYQELFHTPHGTDLAAVAAIGGLAHDAVSVAELPAALSAAVNDPGSTLLVVPVPVATNRAGFTSLRAAVADALA